MDERIYKVTRKNNIELLYVFTAPKGKREFHVSLFLCKDQDSPYVNFLSFCLFGYWWWQCWWCQGLEFWGVTFSLCVRSVVDIIFLGGKRMPKLFLWVYNHNCFNYNFYQSVVRGRVTPLACCFPKATRKCYKYRGITVPWVSLRHSLVVAGRVLRVYRTLE